MVIIHFRWPLYTRTSWLYAQSTNVVEVGMEIEQQHWSGNFMLIKLAFGWIGRRCVDVHTVHVDTWTHCLASAFIMQPTQVSLIWSMSTQLNAIPLRFPVPVPVSSAKLGYYIGFVYKLKLVATRTVLEYNAPSPGTATSGFLWNFIMMGRQELCAGCSTMKGTCGCLPTDWH